MNTSRAKVLTGGGGEACAKRKSTSRCLLAIPAFDLGPVTDTLTVTVGYAYANGLKSG
jgi:hypothetical protein